MKLKGMHMLTNNIFSTGRKNHGGAGSRTLPSKGLFLLVLLLPTFFALFGCATLMNPSTQYVPINTDPPNSNFFVNGKDYKTPALLEVNNQNVVDSITISRQGYEDATIEFYQGVSPWFYGNLLLLPAAPIGMLVDYLTDSISVTRPDYVSIRMRRSDVNPFFYSYNSDIAIAYPSDAPLNDGDIFLIVAASRGEVDRVVSMVSSPNVEIDQVDAVTGDNALIAAVKNRYNDIAIVLSNSGININHKNNDGQTALMVAAKQGNLFMVKELLNRGAKLNMVDISGNNELFYATQGGYNGIIDLLLDESSNPNISNNNGNTPLMIAAGTSNLYILERLLTAGASPNRLNFDQQTPLTIAITFSNYNVARRLIQSGADVNIRVAQRKTPLIVSAELSSVQTMYLLLLNGANPDTQDQLGNTALYYAVENSNNQGVSILLRFGARATVQNNDGLTAIDVAASNNDETLYSLLTGGQELTPKSVTTGTRGVTTPIVIRGN